jgi:hypothetical protein
MTVKVQKNDQKKCLVKEFTKKVLADFRSVNR